MDYVRDTANYVKDIKDYVRNIMNYVWNTGNYDRKIAGYWAFLTVLLLFAFLNKELM